MKIEEDYEYINGDFSEVSHESFLEHSKRQHYEMVYRSYDPQLITSERLAEEKSKVLRYKPGKWIEGLSLHQYNVPKTTSLILIGPKGSGKSSLLNRISRVFNDKFNAQRAQVSYNSPSGGTHYLQEYMILEDSALCLYDTRGLGYSPYDNINMIKRWMTEGVRNGQPVICKSDNLRLRNRLMREAHDREFCELRKVNFVIFVVNGVEVLKSMEDESDSENSYNQRIAKAFNSQYLSFKDDKPAVAVTHGDLLSVADRARVRVYLGELFGVPPAAQIFDVPDNCDPATELTIVELIVHSLEHADKNLKIRPRLIYNKVVRASFLWLMLLWFTLGTMFIFSAEQHVPKLGNMRHMHKIPQAYVSSLQKPNDGLKEVNREYNSQPLHNKVNAKAVEEEDQGQSLLEEGNGQLVNKKGNTKSVKQPYKKITQPVEKAGEYSLYDLQKERAKERGNERTKEQGNERTKERGNERKKERGNERTKEQGNERTKERGNERKKEQGNERTKERANERVNEQAKERAREWVNERAKERANEQENKRSNERANKQEKNRVWCGGSRQTRMYKLATKIYKAGIYTFYDLWTEGW